MFWKKPTVQDLLKLYASMTDEEKAEWAAGEKRNQLRKQRRIEQY